MSSSEYQSLTNLNLNFCQQITLLYNVKRGKGGGMNVIKFRVIHLLTEKEIVMSDETYHSNQLKFLLRTKHYLAAETHLENPVFS